MSSYQQKWYLENKEQILAQQKIYRQANKERIALKNKEYKEKNKEKIAAQHLMKIIRNHQCDICNGHYKYNKKMCHFRTKKHQIALKNQEMMENDPPNTPI